MRKRIGVLPSPPLGKCRLCGKQIQRRSANAIFCSTTCRARARVARLGPRGSYGRFGDVLVRDPCAYCGDVANSIDHIEPRVAGGTDDYGNLTAACQSCNSSKRDVPLLFFLLRRNGVAA
jgi:hypothetical protein